MKLTAVFLFSICVAASATGHAQKITLSEDQVPIQKIFREIWKQSGFQFVYTDKTLEGAKPVTIHVKDEALNNVLQLCFQQQPFDFTITDGAIVVKQKVIGDLSLQEPGQSTPSIDITGRITNEQGEPMAGASVIIKRTGAGDIADAKGFFKLKNVNSDDIIIISFAGYKTQNIKVNSITKFTIVMQVTTNDLDKVVIQAYGTTTDRLRTGNIATVTKEQIERQPVMNVLAAIQSQVPGLIINQNSGYASSPFKVELRGRSGINPLIPADPLYVVDGVPLTILESPDNGGKYASGSLGVTQNGFSGPANGQSPFFSINPEDIESITVLKDADATAIYGSRGANGVIIITTKKGKAGKTNFEANVQQGFSKVTQHYSLLNTQQYLAMRREAFKNDGITPTASNAYDLLIWDTTRYTDWQKELWGGTGKSMDIQTSLSGGDKLTTFRIGGAYHKETSILNYSGADQRGSVQFNLNHISINQRLVLLLTSIYSFTESNLIAIPNAVLLPPNAPPIFDASGHLNWQGWAPVSGNLGTFGNLFDPYVAKTGFLNSRFNIQYEFFKGFRFSMNLGYGSTHQSQKLISPIISVNPANNPTGTAVFGNNNITTTILEPQFEYARTISKGKFNAIIGSSLQSTAEDGNQIIGTGYVNDNLLNSISNAPTKSASDVYLRYKYEAIFGRINYDWRDKLILNISARRDGSSRFGPGKQFGNFWAVGSAWIFTEESWFRTHLQFLSFGKLRASYGLTGSDEIFDYQYLNQWSASSTLPYQNAPSYIPLLHANPDLQWQTNRKLEAAINLGFWENRISMELAWYRNRCGNQLVQYNLPIITGFGSVSSNFPATVQNTGLEMILKTKLITNKKIEWILNFNIGANRNKLLEFPNLEQSPYYYTYFVGEPLNIVRLLHFTGVDPQTGLYTYQDKNKDGVINTNSGPSDDFYNKEFNVKFDGAFGTDFSYKNFQISLLFTFRKQLTPSAVFNGFPGQTGRNQSIQVLDHWRAPGDVAEFAKFSTTAPVSYSNLKVSDGVYSDGSYVRMRNLSLSYGLSAKAIEKLKIKELKVFLRAQNLFLITKYNGVDPDVPGLGALPPAKAATIGFQLKL